MKRPKASRALAVFMAVVMALTMTTTIAFGANGEGEPAAKESKNLLVFGASTSSGYGLSNFENRNRGFAVDNNDLNEWTMKAAIANNNSGNRAKGRMSEDAYPWLLKNYIAEQEFGGDLSKVNLSPLCLNGMRTNELHGFLDPEYAQEAVDLENELVGEGNGFYVEHIQSITDCLGDGGAKVDRGD